MIETEINKEIREYKETLIVGLTMRQLFFSALGCGISIGIYFLLRGRLGTEAVSWACIFGMLPCALMGFIRYNGMSAEKVIYAIIRIKFFMPRNLTYMPCNLFEELEKESKSEEKKRSRKNFIRRSKQGAGLL